MSHLRNRRPSPAMVVALIALLVAMGGTAYAAINLPKNSVGTAQLKKHAVTGAKLSANAVTAATVKPGSLLAKDFASGQLRAGPQGTTGATGATGAPGATGATGPAGPGNTEWQIAVNADGSTQSAHAGTSATRVSAGRYTVSWTGFPGGHAGAYCTGIPGQFTVPNETTSPDGSGSITLDFNHIDTLFSCVIIGVNG